MNKDDIKFYTATWCGYCQNLKAFMDRSNINYHSIDIDKNPESIDELYKYQKSCCQVHRRYGHTLYSQHNHEWNIFEDKKVDDDR